MQKKEPKQISKQEWANANRVKAHQLLMDALVLQNELFEQGDLTPYLDLLSKLPYMNSRNLLLLTTRYPEATCLYGFRIWQNQLPDSMLPVLRYGQAGKGIDLLVPFTDLSNNALTWYAATHFDISQTNVKQTVSYTPYKPNNQNHLSFLLSSISAVLQDQYRIRIRTASSSEEQELLDESRAEGIILPDAFVLHPDLSPEDKGRWLTVSLCRLYYRNQNCEKAFENYLSLCSAYCMFKLWSLNDTSISTHNPLFVTSVANDHRMFFLDTLQNCIHTIHSQISEAYEAAASLDTEISSELK